MGHIKGVFLRGLIAVVPITATLFLFIWLATSAENLAGKLLKSVFPHLTYMPGMGVVFALLFIFVIGLILNAWIAQQILYLGENLLHKIPFIKTIYASMKDLVGFFSADRSKGLNSVVLVNMGENRKILGLVTRENFEDEKILSKEKLVSVYFPMSYQLGGYTVFIPKTQLEEVNIPVDQALSQTLTGWVQSKES